MVGLTSISFRGLDYKEIIDMCEKNGVEVIEWGADVHVPPGDLKRAEKIGKATRVKGMKTISYGTYYHLSENENIEKSFSQILKTAEALECQIIRVWAGSILGMKDLEQEYKRNVAELKIICEMAAEKNMVIGLEYHRDTLTETKEMTLKLLKGVNMKNLRTYWQLNPDITHEERLKEIKLLKEYICNVHVFYWLSGKEGDIREPLSKGRQYWNQYWELLKDCDCPGILEFVKNDDVKQFEEDIEELKGIQVDKYKVATKLTPQ